MTSAVQVAENQPLNLPKIWQAALRNLEQRLPQMRDDIKALKAKLKALEEEFSD